MVKTNSNKVESLKVNLRFACMLLANVCDDFSMMPMIDGRPLNSMQLFTYFNLNKIMFTSLYYELQRNNIMATVVTAGLESIVLNPEFFTGYKQTPIIDFLRDYIFGKQNVFMKGKSVYENKEDMAVLKKRIKEFSKMGYIS